MADRRTASENRRRVKSVANAIRVLEVLKSAREPLRLSEISEQLGLEKSTVHLLLATLGDFNFVQPYGAVGHYRLGLGAFEVGAAALDRLNFPPQLRPPMERLADRSMEAVSLAVRSGGSALIVNRYESSYILRAEIGIGTRMPLHASASGMVLLAGMHNDQLQELYPSDLLPDTGYATIRAKQSLLRELDRIRRVGYATVKDGFTAGVAAVAAPVLDRSGQTAAALSIAGPTNRFEETRWIKDLLETAAEMSTILGHKETKQR